MDKQEQSPASFKVLVVDDNRDVADSLAKLIGVLGHQATSAYDGSSALRLAESECPDAVFLDIGMPDLDGYDVARQIADLRGSPDFRLVAVTGFSDASHREQASKAGFTDYLVKPFVSADVVRILSGPALLAG